MKGNKRKIFHSQIFERRANLFCVYHNFINSLRQNICCFFKNLAVYYLTFTALHSADKFLNEQQIFGLNSRKKPDKKFHTKRML